MFKGLSCPLCHAAFRPKGKQLALLQRAAQRGMAFMMTECPVCCASVGFNPLRDDGRTDPEPASPACPVKDCTGRVVDLTQTDAIGAVFGCGICGSTWASRADVERASGRG